MRRKQQPSFKNQRQAERRGSVTAVTQYRDVITLVDRKSDDP